MSERTPFKPHYGTNQVVNPAAVAAGVTLAKGDKSVRVVNTGANIGYFRIANGNATTADCPVAAGTTVIVEKAQDETAMSVISALGTTFQIMTGEGGYY